VESALLHDNRSLDAFSLRARITAEMCAEAIDQGAVADNIQLAAKDSFTGIGF
jgi:hypothetical protein